MNLKRKKIACISAFILYVTSLVLVIGVGGDVILTFVEFISESKGIGVYGVLLYYAAIFLSVILWSISYWLIPNKKLAIFYWVIFFIFTIFIVIQPTWWAAP